MPRRSLASPFGLLTVTETGGRIAAVSWESGWSDDTPLLAEAEMQLAAYFARSRRAFDLPLAMAPGLTGQVQRAMLAIPFGDTRTYGEIARVLGTNAQAIGQACGANAIPILIPCHRVLGQSGLGGFSAPGGVETKVALLRHEGAAGLLI